MLQAACRVGVGYNTALHLTACRGECWNLTWTPVQINGQVARSLGMGRAGSSLGPQGPSCTQRKMRFGERRRPSKLKVPPKIMSISGTWFLHTSISFCGLSILLNLVYTFSWGKNNWSLCNISFLSGRLYVGESVGGKGVNDEGGCREKNDNCHLRTSHSILLSSTWIRRSACFFTGKWQSGDEWEKLWIILLPEASYSLPHH